jgi:DNA repair photolyase
MPGVLENVFDGRQEGMKPIYEPKGRAKEYGDYAINIYTGCPHRCYYCFAPNVLHKVKEKFHSHTVSRNGIVEAVKRQLEAEHITGKLIHLCFTCDPYPMGYDTTPTREVIKAIKDSGNHVQILTKGNGIRDLDLLDENDWYGTTLTGATPRQEPGAAGARNRLFTLSAARNKGIKTWASFEPIINAEWVLSCIAAHGEIFDKIKIGKLNYYPSDINWGEFGRRCEALCRERGLNYYIKDDLRRAMSDA